MDINIKKYFPLPFGPLFLYAIKLMPFKLLTVLCVFTDYIVYLLSINKCRCEKGRKQYHHTHFFHKNWKTCIWRWIDIIPTMILSVTLSSCVIEQDIHFRLITSSKIHPRLYLYTYITQNVDWPGKKSHPY